ncbi:AIPR family protein [Vibrio sp. Isolate34]|uniref:AIPR family protein n=1 Tax=Vibrio sp. Isolate34 TaxID=2908540 RepID=UPI001EFDC3A4|nr:AIPR family protein [Vibrio sp. Isolate34]MCG9638755.1 AIPR family protein [Vibrio sp. Isolate34]
MANINDFKLLKIKSTNYYKEAERVLDISISNQVEQARFGFYFFILDILYGVNDIEEARDLITDTNFNKIIMGSKDDDGGIDAVYIDDEEKIVNLFNFKYREKFSVDSRQKLNDVTTSLKYITALAEGDISHFSGKPREYAEKIKDLYNSNEVWKTRIYFVSNDMSTVDLSDPHIKNISNSFDVEVNAICLKDISEMVSIRPEPISATLVLPNNALMSYSESDLSSSISYIARLKSSEIVRITCNDKNLRHNHNLENYRELSDVKLDFGVLFDNVRGFVQKSKYNENIKETLKDNPSKFFMYNNGITIVAQGIETESINGNTKQKIIIDNFQVLNGGQTVRTIHNFNSQHEDHITDYLPYSEVLVRIFMTGKSNTGEINNIAEYTNSQNSISPADLKSSDERQIQIEKYLKEKNINYVRKSGDLGKGDANYEYSITMIKFGQLLYAKQGFPEKSTSSKKSIFTKNYTTIFGDKKFDIDESERLVTDFYSIKAAYESSSYESLDIKHYYLIYLNQEFPEVSLTRKMDILEDHICTYTVDKDTSNVRKMSQTRFKEELLDKF